MPIVGFLLYALLGLAQIIAYLDGVHLWLGLGTVLGLIIFFGTAAFPFGAFVDASISFYGAHAAWHWPVWQAALLSFPFAIAGVVFGGASLGQAFFKEAAKKVGIKRPKTAMDAFVAATYGDKKKAKSADLRQAIIVANEMLLCGAVPLAEVEQLAKNLYNGPMPYSTHDLAVATALAFYKNKNFFSALEPHQVMARFQVLNWARERKIVPMLAKAFEDTLYKMYQPRT